MWVFIDIWCCRIRHGFWLHAHFRIFVCARYVVILYRSCRFLPRSVVHGRGTLYILRAADRLYESTARKPWLTVYRAQQVTRGGPALRAHRAETMVAGLPRAASIAHGELFRTWPGRRQFTFKLFWAIVRTGISHGFEQFSEVGRIPGG